MCGGITYTYNNKTIKTYFPSPYAGLPIKLENGTFSLLPWGRRQEEAGNLPLGGWARLESIKSGIWDKYFPKPVKIFAQSFMEKDIEGNSHWFNIIRGQFIQGLVAAYDQERRAYVVTIKPQAPNNTYARWPRILNAII